MVANLTPMLWVHFVAVTAALFIGIVQLVGTKGTANHRRAGWLYVVAMLLGNLGALTSYRLGFNLFHIFAFVSLVSLFFAMRALRRLRATRDPKWMRGHRINMGYSYLGLVMAGVSQFATNPRWGLAAEMPPPLFWTAFAIVNVIMYVAGTWLIMRKADQAAQSLAA